MLGVIGADGHRHLATTHFYEHRFLDAYSKRSAPILRDALSSLHPEVQMFE